MGRSGVGQWSVRRVRRASSWACTADGTRSPKPGGFQLQALSAPFHIVAVPKIEGEVKFTVEEGKGSTR